MRKKYRRHEPHKEKRRKRRRSVKGETQQRDDKLEDEEREHLRMKTWFAVPWFPEP
jgi:hypothetical protein